MMVEARVPAALAWLRVGLLWLGGVFAAMQFSKVSLAFTQLQQYYQATPTQMGWVLSTVGTVGLVFGVTAGMYAPRIGYRRLLLIGLGVGALMAALQVFMLPMPLLFATRVGEAVSQLAVVVGAPTLIVAHAPPRQRAVAMGLWATFVGVGFALTAACHGAIEAAWGLPGLFAVHAVGLALLTLASALLLPRGVPAPGPQAAAWPDWRALPAYHARIYTRLGTALPGLSFFCYTVIAIALLTFVPRSAGADAGWLAVLLPFLVIAGNFASGWLVQAGLKPFVLARLAFVAVALAGLLMGLALYLGTAVAAAGILLMLMVGVAGGVSYGLIPTLNPDSAGQAGAYGAIAQMGNLGSTLGPPLFASLITAFAGVGLVAPVVCAGVAGLLLTQWGERGLAALQVGGVHGKEPQDGLR